MGNILAIGDVHGDTTGICNVAIPKAQKHDCDLIVQCGDFGYWAHTEKGREYIRKVSKHLVRAGIPLYWIDGNHENHTMLREVISKLTPTDEGLYEIAPNLFYVPRGTVFTHSGVTCLGLGGAFSIDKDWRLQKEFQAAGLLRWDQYIWQIEKDIGSDFVHTMWWPEEMTTDDDVDTAIRNTEGRTVDIMFTHDVPEGLDVPGIHAAGKRNWHENHVVRDRLRRAYDAVQPKLLVHGHYHVRYSGVLPLKGYQDYCRVDGLNMSSNGPGFAVVLDLQGLFAVGLDDQPLW